MHYSYSKVFFFLKLFIWIGNNCLNDLFYNMQGNGPQDVFNKEKLIKIYHYLIIIIIIIIILIIIFEPKCANQIAFLNTALYRFQNWFQ